MGNEDGITEAMANMGKNKNIYVGESFFSFAFGNEIALVIDDNYYILNCDENLWNEVDVKTKETDDINILKEWWKSKSKEYVISDWSDSFDKL